MKSLRNISDQPALHTVSPPLCKRTVALSFKPLAQLSTCDTSFFLSLKTYMQFLSLVTPTSQSFEPRFLAVFALAHVAQRILQPICVRYEGMRVERETQGRIHASE